MKSIGTWIHKVFEMDCKLFNILLLITIIGEFLLPWILKLFYMDYNSKTMVISVLGSRESPVKTIYNGWLLWLGVFLSVTAYFFYIDLRTTSTVLAVLTFGTIAVFAVGAGILASLFSVNEIKEQVTISSQIHGMGSALGFMALLFFPLLQSISGFQNEDILQGIICMTAFALAILFFVFFIMGDKETFKGTVISYEGLWERLSLFFMYVPFLYHIIQNLLV